MCFVARALSSHLSIMIRVFLFVRDAQKSKDLSAFTDSAILRAPHLLWQNTHTKTIAFCVFVFLGGPSGCTLGDLYDATKLQTKNFVLNSFGWPKWVYPVGSL